MPSLFETPQKNVDPNPNPRKRVCTYLRSCSKLEVGIYRRIWCLCEPQILDIVGGEALSDPDVLGGSIDEVSQHRLEHSAQ